METEAIQASVFEQEQKNRCSGSAECTNAGEIILTVPTDNMVE
jgi:hypothetical protein